MQYSAFNLKGYNYYANEWKLLFKLLPEHTKNPEILKEIAVPLGGEYYGITEFTCKCEKHSDYHPILIGKILLLTIYRK